MATKQQYESFFKGKAKSPAQKLALWMQVEFPNQIRVGSTNRGRGNHNHNKGMDAGNIEHLPEADQRRLFKKALSLGLRIGKELDGVKDDGSGWTGPHYHFDSVGSYNFSRDKGGKTSNSDRDKDGHKYNSAWQDYIAGLKSEMKKEGKISYDRKDHKGAVLSLKNWAKKGESISNIKKAYKKYSLNSSVPTKKTKELTTSSPSSLSKKDWFYQQYKEGNEGTVQNYNGKKYKIDLSKKDQIAFAKRSKEQEVFFNNLLDTNPNEDYVTSREPIKERTAVETTEGLNALLDELLKAEQAPEIEEGPQQDIVEEDTEMTDFSNSVQSDSEIDILEESESGAQNQETLIEADKKDKDVFKSMDTGMRLASAGEVLPQEIQESQDEPITEQPREDVKEKSDFTLPNFSVSAVNENVSFESPEEEIGMLDTAIENIENFTVEGMGNDLINNFTDRNAVGFLVSGAIKHTQLDKEFDPTFNAVEDPQFAELTKDLDNEDLEEVLQYSDNKHDFIVSTALLNGRVKRTKEMEEYSREHPVLSGTNMVGSLLTEGAVFMPVSSLASAALGATRVKKVNDLYKASRTAKFAAGELIEQGGQEILWTKNAKDYEFDPLLFGTAVGLGVGLKTVFGSTEADAAFKTLLKNEDGFINITGAEGKKLVDEVTRNLGTERAIALAESITKRKQFAANSIRKNLKAKRSGYVRALNKTKLQLGSAKKGTDVYKKLKGKKQQLSRKIEKFDKNLPNELTSLVEGTHPKLTAAVNPKLDILHVAKELGIDTKLVNTPSKIRKYLGLDKIDVDPSFVIEGEKGYTQAMRVNLKEMKDSVRLNSNEALKYLAGTSGVKSIDKMPLLGKIQIADKLQSLAETDGAVSKLLFNKGNMVSSDNPYTASYYNWMAPDGAGRMGSSQIRAIESQQKYANIHGGELMTLYHAHGDRLYSAIEGGGISKKLKQTFSADSYEEVVEPLFNERLNIGAESFRAKYGDEVADIADDFARGFNKNNKNMDKRVKEVGVEGSTGYDATEDWYSRQWDNRAVRLVNEDDLNDTVFRAMKSHMEKLDIKKIDEVDLMKHAKNFAYGIRNADITTIEELSSKHIKKLEKLLNKSEGIEKGVLTDEVTRLKKLKAKADAGDLANRVQMDVNVKLADGRPLSDLFENNVIASQKRYIGRMSARIAAAEHGIKNINDLDDWITDAVEYEIKSQAKKGVKNPKEAAKHMEASMRSDLNSFKNGGMSGLHDITDDGASDFLKMVKKYNAARLLQYAPISSIAEVGGAFVEAGVSTVLREYLKPFRHMFNDMWADNPTKFVDTLYDELRGIMGVGMEDFVFSSKGMSKAARITDAGSRGNSAEKVIDVLGRMTHRTYGAVETTNRRVAINALAVKWANHFTNRKKGGVLNAFFGSNGYNNRVLENSGFGKVTEGNVFVPNKLYKDIEKAMNKYPTFDKRGNLVNLNLHKWDSNVKQGFGDALNMQGSHIMITPDATTMALWESTPLGLILTQFGSYTRNAATKVLGQQVGNAVVSSNRGDHSEMVKAAQKIFWGSALGMLSVTLRQGIQRAGGDKEVDLFDEGLIKAAAIGFSRSSMAGNLPTIVDSVSGKFGFDPIFEKTSSMGRSKDFFNLSTTPTGQALTGVKQAGEKALQGDFKGSGMKLLKTSPLYRQIGAQQIFNFIDDEK